MHSNFAVGINAAPGWPLDLSQDRDPVAKPVDAHVG
jgi:hypothetical protein